MITIGIDPGLTGAWAALNEAGEMIGMGDLPIVRDGKLGWIDGAQFFSQLLLMKNAQSPVGQQLHALVERIVPMPQNGRLGAFSQGCTLGSILATLQVIQARIELVTPSQWKKSFNLTSDKAMSLNKARLLFPSAELTRKKDHGRAEALLLAHYAFLKRSK
jgi:crossover junction endodeoxyribonuclease RuvC